MSSPVLWEGLAYICQCIQMQKRYAEYLAEHGFGFGEVVTWATVEREYLTDESFLVKCYRDEEQVGVVLFWPETQADDGTFQTYKGLLAEALGERCFMTLHKKVV
jgi:hypothetical protein